MVIGVTAVIAVLGYFGLKEVYESANKNLERTVRDRYKAEVQHIVEAVAATIESTVTGSIGPELSPDLQEQVKNMVRGAQFVEESSKSNVWKGCFFLYDMGGTLIAHGDTRYRHKEGQILLDWKDDDGVPLVRQLRDKALQGGGFAEYRWEKCNQQGGTFSKISYAKSLRGDQWWLGTGVYVDNIKRAVQVEQSKQQIEQLWAMGITVLVLLGMLAVASWVSAGLAKQLTRPLDTLVESAQIVSKGDYSQRIVENTTHETEVLGDAFNRMVGSINAHVTALTMAQEEGQRLLARIRELTSNEWKKLEEERRRMAGDLHDDTKQRLWNLRIKLDQLAQADGVRARQVVLDEVVEVMNGLSISIRDAIQNLRPSVLDDLGLFPAIRELLEQQCNLAGIVLVADFQDDEVPMSPHVEITIYRVMQEAIMNVIRHANAYQVEVWVTHSETKLEICLQDDGQGFDVEAAMQRIGKDQSLGLLNMKERVESIGGEILFESPTTGGTTVILTIPLPLRRAESETGRRLYE
jgi:signal transduction histidine kinase